MKDFKVSLKPHVSPSLLAKLIQRQRFMLSILRGGSLDGYHGRKYEGKGFVWRAHQLKWTRFRATDFASISKRKIAYSKHSIFLKKSQFNSKNNGGLVCPSAETEKKDGERIWVFWKSRFVSFEVFLGGCIWFYRQHNRFTDTLSSKLGDGLELLHSPIFNEIRCHSYEVASDLLKFASPTLLMASSSVRNEWRTQHQQPVGRVYGTIYLKSTESNGIQIGFIHASSLPSLPWSSVINKLDFANPRQCWLGFASQVWNSEG